MKLMNVKQAYMSKSLLDLGPAWEAGPLKGRFTLCDDSALRFKDVTKGADPVVIGKFLMACVVLVVSTVMVHVVIALALGVSGIGVSVTTTNVAGRSGIVKQITLTPSANNVQVAKALSKEQATPKEADIVVRNMDVGTSIDTVVRTIVALADTVL